MTHEEAIRRAQRDDLWGMQYFWVKDDLRLFENGAVSLYDPDCDGFVPVWIHPAFRL